MFSLYSSRFVAGFLLTFFSLSFVSSSTYAKNLDRKSDSTIALVLIYTEGKAPEQAQPIEPKSHFFPFIPSCVYPVHGTANAVFNTGYGPVTVQFHGTRLWSNSKFCSSSACTWLAQAFLTRPGDEIWLYSVTAASSSRISNWCSAGIPTIVER